MPNNVWKTLLLQLYLWASKNRFILIHKFDRNSLLQRCQTMLSLMQILTTYQKPTFMHQNLQKCSSHFHNWIGCLIELHFTGRKNKRIWKLWSFLDSSCCCLCDIQHGNLLCWHSSKWGWGYHDLILDLIKLLRRTVYGSLSRWVEKGHL